jgi:hypothetical protein
MIIYHFSTIRMLKIKKTPPKNGQMWSYIPVRQEDPEFETSLGFHSKSLSQKQTQNKKWPPTIKD